MKKFECFWGDGYRDIDNKSIIAYYDESFFTEDRGYSEEEIKEINSIAIGDYADFQESGSHWVRRMA